MSMLLRVSVAVGSASGTAQGRTRFAADPTGRALIEQWFADHPDESDVLDTAP